MLTPALCSWLLAALIETTGIRLEPPATFSDKAWRQLSITSTEFEYTKLETSGQRCKSWTLPKGNVWPQCKTHLSLLAWRWQSRRRSEVALLTVKHSVRILGLTHVGRTKRTHTNAGMVRALVNYQFIRMRRHIQSL